MLNAVSEFDWVGEASSGTEAIRAAARLRPDIVLLDVDLPDAEGPVVAEQLLKENSQLVVVAWTVSDAHEDLLRMVKAGSTGYVLKDAGPEELRRALLASTRDELPIPRRMIPAMLRAAAEQAPVSTGPFAALTDREKETLSHMVKGLPIKRIAAEMSISPSSVDSHMRSIYRKLRATNRGEAINAAMRLGLVRVTDL